MDMNQKPVRSATRSDDNVIGYVLTGVVVAATVALTFLLAGMFTTLVTPTQKILFPIMASVLVGGLAGLWMYRRVSSRPGYEPKAWVMPVLGGALTLCIAVCAYICIGMWPVGEKSAMIVDMHHQYAPMMSQLRDMLTNGGDVMYSFDIGTGTSFIPLFAYYLASPLNFLLVLFPESLLAEGILLITLIKMTLTGAFMTLCLQYVYKRRSVMTIAVGVMYAFMMYMLAYSWDVMWLDCVMMLPLVIMGFERMMREGKYLLYVLSLAYSLYSNYYIGFMICIFMVLYYVVFLLRAKRPFMAQMIGLSRFTIGSLIGGGLAMFILLPAYLSLSSTSAAGAAMPSLATNFNIFELIGRGMFGVEPTIRSGNLPNTYCGVMAVLALPIFATMSSIPYRRRLAYLGLFGFMALSLVINHLDLMWHGLHSPNDLPYRFSFLYSISLLLITFEVLLRIRDIKPKQIALSIFGISIYLILEENFGSGKYNFISLYVSFALIVIYGFVMFLVSRDRMKIRVASALLLMLVAGELLFNASGTFGRLNNNEHYTNHKDYVDNITTIAVKETVAEMEAIHQANDGQNFYRMEFLPRRTTADTAMFDYHGITNFASTGSYNMTRFMGSLGYDVNGVNSQLYKSFVPTADSLIGIKYVALEADIQNHPQLKQIDKVYVSDSVTKYFNKYYEQSQNSKLFQAIRAVHGDAIDNMIRNDVTLQEGEERTYYIYENPYALPLGYMVEEGIKDWNYNYYDPMASQNSLYRTMTGTTDNVMYCHQIQSTNSSAASVNGVSAFSIHGAQSAVFTTIIDREAPTYIHVDCRAAKSINVSAAGNSWGVTTYEPYIIDAGILPAGTEVTVTVTSDNSCAGNVFVASMDQSVFERDITALQSSGLKVTDFSDSHLVGTIYAQKSGVMMTSIEFDEGWTVKVDGQKVDTFAVGDALLAIDLEAGEHIIEFSFTPKGFVIGLVLSAVSLLGLFVLLWFVKRRDAGLPFLPTKKTNNKGAVDQ